MTAMNMRALRNWSPRKLDFNDPQLWQRVIMAPSILTLLDFDGTLVEIAPTPADVEFAAPRKRWLEEIYSLPGCSVGIVSGRPIDELKRLVGIDDIFYVGCHGLEWTAPDGMCYMSWPNQAMVDALASLRAEMRQALAGLAGLVLEDKGLSLALHYRQAERDTAVAARKEFVRAVGWYQQQGVKLQLLTGKEVIEARPAGTTKGDAVAQIWARYAPAALPIYIGDDVTDESAFDAIGEKGLPILVAERARASAAQLLLKNPTEVYVFLRCLTHIRERRESH